MRSRSKLAWKLTAVATAILIVALEIAPYVPVFVPPLAGIVALWFMFGLMLERPFRKLVEGTKQIADHQLDFRFDRTRSDEIGLLEESFNAMTATIQASQDELGDAKQYLEGMIENSADMIITVNSEGLIETFNRGGEEMLGHRREEVIGKRIETLFVEPRERHEATVRLRKTGHVKNYETRLLARDGQVRNVLLTLSYLRDSQGEPIGTIGISKDITQEKELQDELRDAKQYLEGMIENSADMIITVNSQELIETFNRGGEEMLGHRREEVIGKEIESLYVDPHQRRTAVALLEKTGSVKNYEVNLLTKDGQVRNVLLTLSRLRNVEGEPIGTIGISKDITQEKRLQQELIQSQKFAAIGQAVTGIQHAIKNMLDALQGGAYLVRNGMAKDNPQRIERGCSMVEEGIGHISSLAHNMLNFAKEWKPELERVDLNDLVVSICELNQQTAVDHGITLRHVTPEGLPHVLCDPKLIHIGATDILVNAIDACDSKHYDDGERAEIVLRNSLGDDGDSFVIEIRDNGCGMTDAVRRNVFVPFFSTKKTLGTGLGLAITARIVRVHGGVLSVESEPDRGTTFKIRLPVDGTGNKKEAEDGQASSRN